MGGVTRVRGIIDFATLRGSHARGKEEGDKAA